MKQYLYNCFRKLFAEQIARELDNAKRSGFHEQREYERKLKHESDFVTLKSYVGSAVICLSNEVQVPVIGIGKRIELVTQAMQPILVVQDYVTGQEQFIFGNTYFYTPQLFNMLFNVDTNALIALLYSARYSDSEVFKKPIEGFSFDKGAVVEQLQKTGFYDKYIQSKLNKNGKNKDV